MIINKILHDRKMSAYKLSKLSGVPQSTIADICSCKTTIINCKVSTLYKIAKTLNVTVDYLLEEDAKEKKNSNDYRTSFEVFKGNVCHRVKDLGDIRFIIEVLKSDEIRTLFNKGWYPEALYLLGMVDYLSNLNDVSLCTNYNDLRCCKLDEIVYPSDVLLHSALTHDESIKEKALRDAIPEFRRFNIIESEVRDVV